MKHPQKVLLLKAEKVLGKDAVRNGFYGDVGFDKFDIACEDTLTAPQHEFDPAYMMVAEESAPYGKTEN